MLPGGYGASSTAVREGCQSGTGNLTTGYGRFANRVRALTMRFAVAGLEVGRPVGLGLFAYAGFVDR